jgi:hypothetical protein
MARPTLQRNRKWARLVRALGGDEVLARGSLELMWEVAYENGDEYLGDGEDVELAAKWRGEPGKLLQALLTAGGEGEAGFIEEVSGRPGRYQVHDLWDHAPDFVRKRRQRESERRTKGAKLRRAADADRSSSGQGPDDDGRSAPSGRTRARALAPTQEESSSLRSEGAPPAASPAEQPSQDAQGPGEEAHHDRREAAREASGAGGGAKTAPSSAAGKSEFALAVEHWFTAWERAGRGKHARLTEAEGKQLKTLLGELGLAETTARMDRALADRWFLEHGDLLAFVKQRNKFAKPGAPANAREAAARREELVARREAAIVREASTCEAAAATLRVLATRIRPDLFDRWLADLRGELRGQVLEFTAPDAYAAAFVADQYQDLLVQAARAANGDGLHVQVIGPRGAAGAEA